MQDTAGAEYSESALQPWVEVLAPSLRSLTNVREELQYL